MHDHAWRAKTRIHDSHILHAGLLPDPAENSRRVSYTHETLISSKKLIPMNVQVKLTLPPILFLNLNLEPSQEDI